MGFWPLLCMVGIGSFLLGVALAGIRQERD